jgi:hypothetical protein
MTDTAKLREMLAAVVQEADDIRYYGGPTSTYTPAADALKQELAQALPAMLDEIDTLRARVGDLEGALKPFVDRCNTAVYNSDDDTSGITCRVKDLRAARAAIQGTKP